MILQLVNFIHFSIYQILFSIMAYTFKIKDLVNYESVFYVMVWMKYCNIYLLVWYSVKFKGYVGICMDSSGDKLLIRRDE